MSVIGEPLARALADMARDLLAKQTVQQTLDAIVDYAVSLVDGCEAAGILIVRNGRVQTLTASDNVVSASDRIQGELREGPCYDAARRNTEAYRLADVSSAGDRWPRYAPKARELGIGSILGFLLFTNDEHDLGALDLYSSQPNAFTEHSETVGWLLASHAAVALSSARTDANLHEAIATRQDIGEAIGIIMERRKTSEHQAFDVLVRASQKRNVKLREIARAVNTTGEIPDE